MLDLRSEGLTLARIGEELERHGCTGRNGQRLSAKLVGSVLIRAHDSRESPD